MTAVLGPIISAGIGGGMQYAGGKAQADATKQASQLQNQFNEKALAAAQEQLKWQREQYGNYLQRMQPYNQLGLNAGSTLSNLLARSPYTRMANQGPLPVYSQQAPQAPGAPPSTGAPLPQDPRLVGSFNVPPGYVPPDDPQMARP
jgi:hypothetical protein